MDLGKCKSSVAGKCLFIKLSIYMTLSGGRNTVMVSWSANQCVKLSWIQSKLHFSVAVRWLSHRWRVTKMFFFLLSIHPAWSLHSISCGHHMPMPESGRGGTAPSSAPSLLSSSDESFSELMERKEQMFNGKLSWRTSMSVQHWARIIVCECMYACVCV